MVGTWDEERDFFTNYKKHLTHATDHIWNRAWKTLEQKPQFGITLGSGLSDLIKTMEIDETIPFAEIPGFPVTTVHGHEGNVLVGRIADVAVIGLQGRIHYYEHAHEPFGNGMLRAVFPVHVLANLDVPNYFVTNAAGGLDTAYRPGDTMAITSHIHMLPNPLLGPVMGFERVDEGPSWQFQPMHDAYDDDLRTMLVAASPKPDRMHEGVYLAVTGPTYESKAEARAFRAMGANAVGMSTTHETIVARNRGMKVVGLSCITNCISEDGTNATSHEEVTAVLDRRETRERLANTITNFFAAYKASR